MSVKERMMICKVVEQMEKNKIYSKQLGLENRSTFRGRPVEPPDRVKKHE